MKLPKLLIDIDEIIALEANTQSNIDPSVMANRETNPSMQIGIITDKIIENSKLPCVSSPIMFTNGTEYHDDGLFSLKIFGDTSDQRRRQCAYIDLHQKFFHPFVYEILCKLDLKFNTCASGKGAFVIEDGKLLEIKDPDDKRYNEENCGINWLIKNFDKFDFKRNSSNTRGDRITMISSLKKEEIFITKFIVIPVFYRDADFSNNKRVIPELNKMYAKLIQWANGLDDSGLVFFNNGQCYSIQDTLVNIRKYGQSLIEKKHGHFHKAILGKSTDYGSRDVISVAVMNNYQTPKQNPVDIFHTGIPLNKCLVLAYPFIKRYCLDFFGDNLRNLNEMPIYDYKNGQYQIVGKVKIKNQLQIYTASYIDKKMEQFMKSPATRFETINVIGEDGKEYPMHFSGMPEPLPGVKISKFNKSLYERPFTWTDLFYMAAYDTCSDKYVYITRYPVTSYASIFPSKCIPLSTSNTMPIKVYNKVYSNYPVVDLTLTPEEVSISFVDTLTMSNLFLSALGGDFDGDQVSSKLCFSLEANKEAEEIAESVRSFIRPDGGFLRLIGNESYLTFYNMTRQDAKALMTTKEIKETLLGLKKEDITLELLTKLFSYTGAVEGGKFYRNAPPISVYSKLVLDAGEYINKERISTTVGIFLFNKLLVEGDISNCIPNGYYNETINKKKFGQFLSYIGKAILNGQIKINPSVYEFLQNYEFWSLRLVTIFSPSYSAGLVVPSKRLKETKQKMMGETKNASTAELVEMRDKLLDVARDDIKNEAGKTLFDSSARGSFENDFGNMFVAVGPVENPVTGKFDFMESNYINGISKKDLVAAGNIIVNSEYPKAVGTQVGGYQTKKFNAVYQTITVGPKDSDCGTKNGLNVTLTKDNLATYVDQYIMNPNGSLTLITEDLDVKYMNHPIKVRSPMYCLHLEKDDALCNKCAGERFNKLGVDSLGLTASDLSSQVLNAGLKLRHSLKVEVNKINPTTLLK